MLAGFARKHLGAIDIDKKSNLFLTLYTGKPLSMSNQPDMRRLNKMIAFHHRGQWPELFWNPSRTYPAVLHSPGDGNINSILERLGYDLPASVRNYSQLDHMKYLHKNLKSYYPLMKNEMAYISIMAILIATIGILLCVYAGQKIGSFMKR